MIISVIGSGGKTTKIKELKDQYISENKTVLITTSTHMKIEEDTLVNPTYQQIMSCINEKGYCHAGQLSENNKITSLDHNLINQLKNEIDIILIEADGSKGLPAKYPRNDEPVILPNTDTIILITSFLALGKPIKDVIHGYEQFLNETNYNENDLVTIFMIDQLIKIYLKKLALMNKKILIQVNEANGLYQKVMAKMIEEQYDLSLINSNWFVAQPHLVILGAGHVSQYVCQIAQLLDFYTIVIDDRIEFANEKLFPEANEVHCISYHDAQRYFPNEKNTCFVIVTRGHKDDKLCLKKVIDIESLYVGMIGSRKKVKKTFDDLLNEGYSQDLINRVHAPIGLDIHAVTPGEIAISIMAEIIDIKNKYQYSSISKELLNVHQDGVLCIITKKTGSTPRNVGSTMFVTQDTSIIGSIGGGSIEHQVIYDALKTQHITKKHYELNNNEGAKLGMICGGSNDVLFIPLYFS